MDARRLRRSACHRAEREVFADVDERPVDLEHVDQRLGDALQGLYVVDAEQVAGEVEKASRSRLGREASRISSAFSSKRRARRWSCRCPTSSA